MGGLSTVVATSWTDHKGLAGDNTMRGFADYAGYTVQAQLVYNAMNTIYSKWWYL